MSAERALLNKLALDIGTSLENALGGSVEIGSTHTWHDDIIQNLAVPMRIAVVELSDPLADCIVVASNHREDQLRTIAAAAALAIVQSLDTTADVGMPQMHEFSDRETAVEQLDALFGEPTLHFVCGRGGGEVTMMIGSELVRAALRIDSGTEPLTLEEEEMLELAGAFDFDSSDAAAPATAAASSSGGVAASAQAAGDLDLSTDVAYGDSGPVGGEPSPLQATASENASAAASATSDRWASLLSMVDVEVSAELGSTNLRLGDITGLDSDSILTLDQHVDDPLTVFVNGSAFATARLVVVGDEYGIEILNVIDSGAHISERAFAA